MSARFPSVRPVTRAERRRYHGPSLAWLMGNIGHDAMIIVISRSSGHVFAHLYDEADSELHVGHDAEPLAVYSVSPARTIWRGGDYDAWERPPADSPAPTGSTVRAAMADIRKLAETMGAPSSAVFVWKASGIVSAWHLDGAHAPSAVACAAAQRYQAGLYEARLARGDRGL